MEPETGNLKRSQTNAVLKASADNTAAEKEEKSDLMIDVTIDRSIYGAIQSLDEFRYTELVANNKMCRSESKGLKLM
jgi:hypothetical protein